MKPRRILIIFLVLLFQLILLIAVVGIWFNRYIQSPEFARQVKVEAGKFLGMPVNFSEIHWNLREGISLGSLEIKNSRPNKQISYLMVRNLVLQYNWKSLWERKFDIEKLQVEHPTVLIGQEADGSIDMPANLEPSLKKKSNSKLKGLLSMEPLLRSFDVVDGRIDVIQAGGLSRLQVNGITLHGNCANALGEFMSVDGTVKVDKLIFLDKIVVTNLQSQFSYHAGAFTLTGLETDAYQGKISASMEQDFISKKIPFNIKLAVTGADVNQFMTEALKRPRVVSGKMDAETLWLGPTTDLPSVAGKGTFIVRNGQVIDLPVFRQLAQMIGGITALAQPDFSECKAEYTIAEQVVNVSACSLKSGLFELMGSGKVHFDTTLDFSMKLALNPQLTGQLPKELTSLAEKRADGYLLIPFNVSGTIEQPKISLAISSGMVNKAVDTIKSLLGGQKKNDAPANGAAPADTARPMDALESIFGHRKSPSPTPVPAPVAPLPTAPPTIMSPSMPSTRNGASSEEVPVPTEPPVFMPTPVPTEPPAPVPDPTSS